MSGAGELAAVRGVGELGARGAGGGRGSGGETAQAGLLSDGEAGPAQAPGCRDSSCF